jgi:hypothetical protein
MGADALVQMKEWLTDEIDNRKLFIQTLKGGDGDAGLLADKEAALVLYEKGLVAATASVADLEAFLASLSGNPRGAVLNKMWASLKS